jgi:hypothetical protein
MSARPESPSAFRRLRDGVATALLAAVAAAGSSCADPADAPVAEAEAPPGSMTLSFEDGRFGVNGSAIPFPTELGPLTGLLGPPSRSSRKANVLHTWDDLGIVAYERIGTGRIETIEIACTSESWDFSPAQPFRGSVSLPEGAMSAGSTPADLRALGMTPIGGGPFVMYQRRLGASVVSAKVEDLVEHVSLAWTGVVLSHADPASAAALPLYTARSQAYGFPFDDAVTEVNRRGNVSEIRADSFGESVGGTVGRSLFVAGAMGELASKLGYDYLVVLSEGPCDPPAGASGRSWRYVVGFTNDADPDFAREFPQDFDPSREYAVVPNDLAKQAVAGWPAK